MSPKLKLNLLVAMAVAVVILSAVMLKRSADASNVIKIAWGFFLAAGAMTLVKGIRLYKRIP